jgi:hypothetical protein
LITRIDAIADAVPGDCRAINNRGSAMLQRTPITPHTNIRSISANPWAFRIVTGSALTSRIAELVPSESI